MTTKSRTVHESVTRHPASATTDRNYTRVTIGDDVQYGKKGRGVVLEIELRCKTTIYQEADCVNHRVAGPYRTEVKQSAEAWLLIDTKADGQRWIKWSRVCHPGKWESEIWTRTHADFRDINPEFQRRHAVIMNQLTTALILDDGADHDWQ